MDEQTSSGFGALGVVVPPPEGCPGLDHCGQSADVHERIDGLTRKVGGLAEHVEALETAHSLAEQRLRVVEAGHDYLAQQIGGLAATVDARIGAQTKAVEQIQADLKLNTEATIRLDERSKRTQELLQGVSDALTLGRYAGRAGRWALRSPRTWGALLLAAAACVAWVKGVTIEAWAQVVEAWQTAMGGRQ